MARDQVDMTPIETREDLVAWFEAGSKPRSRFRIGTEHEKFAFTVDGHNPVPYEGRRGICALLEGEIVLIEDGGPTVLQKGEAAGFKAGVANGHHLVNKSKRDAVYLEVGTRAKRERAHYPDIDLVYEKDESGFRFSRRSGEPYPKSGG